MTQAERDLLLTIAENMAAHTPSRIIREVLKDKMEEVRNEQTIEIVFTSPPRPPYVQHQLEFLQMIDAEQTRQVQKWGVQLHDPTHWGIILGEEFGEVCRAIYEKKEDNYIEELVQVAAVAASAYIAHELLKEKNP